MANQKCGKFGLETCPREKRKWNNLPTFYLHFMDLPLGFYGKIVSLPTCTISYHKINQPYLKMNDECRPGHFFLREMHDRSSKSHQFSGELFLGFRWGNFTHRRLRLPQRHNAPPATEPQPKSTHSSFRVLKFRDSFGVSCF